MASEFRVEFETLFKGLRSEVVQYVKELPDLPGLPEEVLDRLDKTLLMNTSGGKYARGMTVMDTATAILPDPISQDKKTDLFVLGWIVEINSAAILVLDDIMDNSTMRLGKPCWYRQPQTMDASCTR